MAVSKVWIEEGCTACELCVDTVPEVFEMDELAVVIEDVDYSEFEEGIVEAADSCPAEVIKYE